MTLHEVSCARLPAAALARLGGVRAREDVRAVVVGESLWVHWPAPDPELAAWFLSLPGVQLLRRDPTGWLVLGRHLPIFDVPDPETGKRLASLLYPPPIVPILPGEATWRPVEVRLVRDDQPRPVTALLLPTRTLATWAEAATTHALAHLSAARCGERVLVRGRLPALVGDRFWGKRVLVPAGWRPEPHLAETVLAQSLHLDDGDFALLTPEGADVLPAIAFGPVTRAGVRLATAEATHAG